MFLFLYVWFFGHGGNFLASELEKNCFCAFPGCLSDVFLFLRLVSRLGENLLASRLEKIFLVLSKQSETDIIRFYIW